MPAKSTIESGFPSFHPDRFLARVVASTVMQRARTWQSWGDAFTRSCAAHAPSSGAGHRLGVVWSVFERDTQGTVAGPWVLDSESTGGSFSPSLIPADWQRVLESSAEQYHRGMIDLSLAEGFAAKLLLVSASAASTTYAELMHSMLLAGIEESYHLGLGRYQAAMHVLMGELAPHHRAVLKLLLDGETEKQIAATLRRNPHTLHDHIRVIYARYKASSRIDLLRAVEERLQREMLRPANPKIINDSTQVPWP